MLACGGVKGGDQDMSPAPYYKIIKAQRRCGVRSPTRFRASKTVFMDRDGVINKDPGGWTKYNYVTTPVEFKFIPGATEALEKLKNAGYRVIVISNQAGVSKGYFSREQLKAVDGHMLKEVKKAGGRIEESFYCIHRDEDNCNCRKPKAGLLEMAAKKYKVKTKNAYFIGDTEADMKAGKAAGAKTILVLSGKAAPGEEKKWPQKPDHVFKDLFEAVNWLLAKDKRKSDRAVRRKDESTKEP
jgi:histidinol-phosphate phosphatase family protein